MDLKTYLAGNFRTIARVTFATAGLLWLIACVNASNLLVARASARRRELAVRAALGASRARLMRYLLAESAVLAVAAAALGATLAWLAITAARTAGAPYIPRAEEIALGGRTLAVLAAATLGSVLLFGLIPALQAGAGARVDEGLRSSSRSSTGSRSVRRVRGVLVALQFAFATPLLVAAGLLLASLGHLARVNLGFDTRNVLTAAVMLPAPEYRDDGAVVTFWDRLRDGLARVPGVSGVAFTDSRPPEDAGNQNNFDLEDYPSGPGQQPVTTWVDVSPEYFGLFGLRLTEGRLFDARDTTTTSPSIVIVDEAWARRFFPGRSALGKRLKGGGCSTCDWTTIVGVVSSVTYDGLHNGQQGIVYTPMTTQGEAVAQSFSGLTRYVMLRSSVSSAAILPHVRRVLHDLDPGVPLTRVATIDELVEQSLEQPRGLSVIVAIVAAVALALSVVGVYGVMTHLVQQQAKDISIRLALGGTPRGVAALVLRRGLTLVAWGVAGGAAASAGLARVLESLLFEVPITDPVTISTVALLLLATAAVACGIPAARAAAAAPAEVLRAD
jgi:predicted permease